MGKLLRAFGAEIMVCDPLLGNAELANGEQKVSLDEGLAAAQVVSLHASGAQCLLGEAEFERMQQGTILLNSARGELVDEEALVQALESERVAAAWFDAFWEEPYQGSLLSFDQVLLTPHVATYTAQCRADMELQAVANLLRDLGVRP